MKVEGVFFKANENCNVRNFVTIVMLKRIFTNGDYNNLIGFLCAQTCRQK